MGRFVCCTLLVLLGWWGSLALQSISAQGRKFAVPRRTVGPDDRGLPRARWITTDWDSSADKPFLSIQQEVSRHKTFQGFDKSGQWARKTKEAYDAWYEDSQNPVRLFRASAYFGILKEVDNATLQSAPFQRMWMHLRLGWYVIENPPRSYWFVRQGYKSTAGDGERQLYGELCRALLKKNSLDRAAFACGVRELWAERPRWKPSTKRMEQLPGKGKEFEEFLLQTGFRIRKTPAWRPWDDVFISDIYWCRTLRTRQKADLQKALEYIDKAIANSPSEWDVASLKSSRESILRFRKFLKG